MNPVKECKYFLEEIFLLKKLKSTKIITITNFKHELEEIDPETLILFYRMLDWGSREHEMELENHVLSKGACEKGVTCGHHAIAWPLESHLKLLYKLASCLC